MPTADYRFQLFLSYARKDNRPIPAEGGEGWVSAFAREFLARHRRWSERPLNLFFDQLAIDDGWRI